MSAILPHLATEETTAEEAAYWDCIGRESGLGQIAPACPTPGTIIDQAHAQLLFVAYTRKIIAQQLQTGRIEYDQASDSLFVSGANITGPAWNPIAFKEADRYRTGLLSWTSKMAAPSFSLGAGAPSIGGSCPGAAAGQSVVHEHIRRNAAQKLLEVLPAKHVRLSESVCEFCYAEKGNYTAASMQYHHLVKKIWLEHALYHDLCDHPVPAGNVECAFVQTMIHAIKNANFWLEGKDRSKKTGEQKVVPEPERHRHRRYFRLHDSGDFFSDAYLQAWVNIAQHFPDIKFWAPSRIWTKGREEVAKVARMNTSSNLIIRPSGYHVGQGPLPRFPGWAAPTVVYRHGTPVAADIWNCQAYAVKDGPNCRKAESIDGKTGCRVCWNNPDEIVNYALH